MPHSLPEGAPAVGNYIIFIAFAFGAIVAAIQGWRWAKKPASNAPNALIAGDIMDTRPMKDLVAEVSRMNEHLTQLGHAEDRQSAAEDRHSAALDRNTDAMRDLCLSIERKMK